MEQISIFDVVNSVVEAPVESVPVDTTAVVKGVNHNKVRLVSEKMNNKLAKLVSKMFKAA